jgi:hypothetical protein
MPIYRIPIVGLRPTVKLGSDTTLSAPQFEGPKGIHICTSIMHKYALNHRNGTQIYNERF